MEKITVEQFLEFVENNLARVEIKEYDSNNLFLVSVNWKDAFLLEVPKEENGYEFIYSEFVKKFKGQYEEYFVDEWTRMWMMFYMSHISVMLKFTRPEGQEWLKACRNRRW